MITNSHFTSTAKNNDASTAKANSFWLKFLVAVVIIITVIGILLLGKVVGKNNQRSSSVDEGSVAYTDFGAYAQYKVTGTQFLYIADKKYNTTLVNTAHAKGSYTTSYRDDHGKMRSQMVTFDHDNKTPIKGDPESYDFDIEDGYVIVKLSNK